MNIAISTVIVAASVVDAFAASERHASAKSVREPHSDS